MSEKPHKCRICTDDCDWDCPGDDKCICTICQETILEENAAQLAEDKREAETIRIQGIGKYL
jgi:hypothetical protein